MTRLASPIAYLARAAAPILADALELAGLAAFVALIALGAPVLRSALL